MYQEQLSQIGLTPKESTVYEVLLDLGKTGIGQILKKIPYKRGDTYNIIYSLIEKGLISETHKKNKKIFVLENPDSLNDLINKQEKQIQHNKNILSQIMPDFKVHYSTVFDKPGVQYLTGLKGFKKIYDDILKTQRDLRVFTSTHDRTNPEMKKIIDHNLIKQYELGIKSRGFAILSRGHSQESLDKIKKFGVEIHVVPDQTLSLPSQIIIYGNKIAITSLKDEIVSTLIENKNITNTLKTIFDYLWTLTKPVHQHIYNSLPPKTHKNMKHTNLKILDLDNNTCQ